MAGPQAAIGRLSFRFEKFTFGVDTNRQRPTWVQGILSNFQSPGTSAPFAFLPNGDSIYIPDPMEGFDRGHVVLASNSGVGDPENIVPMYPCFNQAGGAWRELEYRIASYVKLDVPSKPRATQMTVEIEYGAQDPRFPTAFLVTVKDTNDQGGYLYYKGQALNRTRFTHVPVPAAVIDPVAELGGEFVAEIKLAAAGVKQAGWTIEKLYADAIVTPLTDIPSRPYGFLDWMWLVDKSQRVLNFLTDGCSYKHKFASEFHERQKMLIRIVNALYNAGSIKSDYPGDTTDALIVGSGQRSAQVDHVHPYDNFGPNLFSNAMIASGAFNNRMRTQPAKTKWGDRTGVTLYSRTQHL